MQPFLPANCCLSATIGSEATRCLHGRWEAASQRPNGSAASERSHAMDSAYDQHRYLGVRENFRCLAPEQQAGQPFSSMRSHQDEIAFLLLCDFDDLLIREVAHH